MLEGVCSCLERKITKNHRIFRHKMKGLLILTGLATWYDPNSKKSTKMISTQLELFKTPKNIKIGSRSSMLVCQFFLFAN